MKQHEAAPPYVQERLDQPELSGEAAIALIGLGFDATDEHRPTIETLGEASKADFTAAAAASGIDKSGSGRLWNLLAELYDVQVGIEELQHLPEDSKLRMAILGLRFSQFPDKQGLGWDTTTLSQVDGLDILSLARLMHCVDVAIAGAGDSTKAQERAVMSIIPPHRHGPGNYSLGYHNKMRLITNELLRPFGVSLDQA